MRTVSFIFLPGSRLIAEVLNMLADKFSELSCVGDERPHPVFVGQGLEYRHNIVHERRLAIKRHFAI